MTILADEGKFPSSKFWTSLPYMEDLKRSPRALNDIRRGNKQTLILSFLLTLQQSQKPLHVKVVVSAIVNGEPLRAQSVACQRGEQLANFALKFFGALVKILSIV